MVRERIAGAIVSIHVAAAALIAVLMLSFQNGGWQTVDCFGLAPHLPFPRDKCRFFWSKLFRLKRHHGSGTRGYAS